MKAICTQENLAHALSITSRAVAPRTTPQQILTYVLISTEGDCLKFAATNLNMSITYRMQSHITSEGSVAVPARLFSEIVGLLPKDQLELELDTHTLALYIKSGNTTSHLKGINGEEFPSIPNFDIDDACFIESSKLKKLIEQTYFAASTDKNRPNLAGVLTKIEGQQITMVATDSYRISMRKELLNAPIKSETPLEMLVHASVLGEVARAISDREKDTLVAISMPPSRKQVQFRINNVDIVSQLMEERFPPYESVLYQQWETRAVVNKEELLRACRQAHIFAREVSDMIRLTIQHKPHEPGISVAASATVGDNNSAVHAEVTGPGVELGINARFLIEALNNIDTPSVALEVKSPKHPVTLRAIGDESFLHIIMPMYLPEMR